MGKQNKYLYKVHVQDSQLGSQNISVGWNKLGMWGASTRLCTKTVQIAACAETIPAKMMPSIGENKPQLVLSFCKVAGKDPSFGRQYYLPISNMSSGEHCARCQTL